MARRFNKHHAPLSLSECRGRGPDGSPNPIDVYIGSRIKLRRELLGLSQQRLSTLMGITFQQIQKYEKGGNRIGGSRLWDFCCVLGVEPYYFYAEMPEEVRHSSPRLQSFDPEHLKEADEFFYRVPSDPMWEEESITLVTAFKKINNRPLANSLREAMIAASKAYSPADEKYADAPEKKASHKKIIAQEGKTR